MKKLSFGKVLLIYAAIFLAVIIVVGIVVWNKLKDYQNDYDKAKAAGAPMLLAQELVENWNEETVKTYIEKYGVDNIGEYNSDEALLGIFAPEEADINYIKNAKYTEVMPVYDICNGNKRLAVVSFKPEGSNDSFGFHKWQIRDLAFDTNNIDTFDYVIKVTSDCQVSVNGVALEKAAVNSGSTDTLSKWVKDKYGLSVTYAEYKLEDCVELPDIKVTDISGNEITDYVENKETITYNCTSSEAFVAAVSPRVLDMAHTYISNIYYKATFYQLSQYLVKDSDAYKVIYDVQGGIAWGWHPDVVEIIEESVSDYIEYSDTLFSCKYYAKIYKADDTEEYEEIFNYHFLFEKVNGEYRLTYFNLL